MKPLRKAAAACILPALAQCLGAASLDGIPEEVRADIARGLEELSALQAAVAEEKAPLVRELDRLEAEVLAKRGELDRRLRSADNLRVELSGLETELKGRADINGYISAQLDQYLQEFQDRIHIAELQRYAGAVDAAREAAADPDLGFLGRTRGQLALLDASLDRIEALQGSDSFEGHALTPEGALEQGRFVVSGPVAVFSSKESDSAGLAVPQLGTAEPAVADLGAERSQAIRELVAGGEGILPVDPSLGSALRIAATQDSLIEHMRKGGVVMIPILGLGLAAMLAALARWISLSGHRLASAEELQLAIGYLQAGQEEKAGGIAASKKGIVGDVLRSAIENFREKAETLEEILYEKMLAARPSLQRMLPFIAITAATAPLLGLLGTVTGMIQTFNMIAVFGTGDAGKLSSGISEALITTKFGLVVAVPSLICHAILSRKAKAILGNVELVAIGFVNQAASLPGGGRAGSKD